MSVLAETQGNVQILGVANLSFGFGGHVDRFLPLYHPKILLKYIKRKYWVSQAR